jgi:aminodeoxyfutalosine synthase
MPHTTLFDQALEKGAHGRRLERDEALALAGRITPDGLHALGRAALANRRLRFKDRATFVFNLHINPANICGAGCTFCNYAASRHDAHAYVLSEAEILEKVSHLRPTEAHIVGGLNQVWPYERNLELVRSLRQSYPGLHIKAFTAVEIAYFAKTAKKSEQLILEELKAAGVDALPGGGAEIFSERLYRQHWKNKIGPAEWLRIHALAHALGLSTNATMLFGFGDTWAERIEHLLDPARRAGAVQGFCLFHSAGLSARQR